MKTVVCPTCGKEFVPGFFNGVHHGRKFCSRECGFKGRPRSGGCPPALSIARDPASQKHRRKVLERQRAERARLMASLARWDSVCEAACPVAVAFSRVGRAVVESRGNIPIHNAKRWVTA